MQGILIRGGNMLEIVVHEIRGFCPVYKVGDKIVIDDPTLFLFLEKRKPVLKEKTKKVYLVN